MTANKCLKLAFFSAFAVFFFVGRLLRVRQNIHWEGNRSTTRHAGGFFYFSQEWYNESLFKDVENGSNDHIWFLETSHRRHLTPREACSIESACRHNQGHTVHLLSAENITSATCPYYSIISTLPNFRSEQLNVTVELAETPLAALYATGALHKSPYSTTHLSDFLRYAVLWKRGGVYLDTDVIILKPLAEIRNSVVYQSEKRKGEVVNAMLFFSARHPALGALMDACARVYNPSVWATCGPLITSALPLDAWFSRRVTFLSKSTFMAVPYYKWPDLFFPRAASRVLRAINGSYGVHFWNKLSKGQPVLRGSGCVMEILAKAHCPNVYRLAVRRPYF